ncbi:SPFH domain-containing protein [Streptomyces sp. NPDC057680]|uniref:SPFH domain-containing protein n=1 Tax=Streptomyces sp. NPDC057680 TaxID=3346208 RepID=UPI0036C5CD9F
MTASTPNPADSGAAASRDAARTARRLTDGTLPRTSPPQGAPPGTPPTRRETTEEPREPGAPGESSESRDGAPAEGGAPSPDDVAAAATAAAAAVDDAPTSAAQDVAPVRPGAAPAAAQGVALGGTSAGTSDGAPVGQAPAPESPAAGEPAPSVPAAGEPVTTSRARVPVWPEPGARGGAAAAAASPEATTRPDAPARPEARTGSTAATGSTAPTARITPTAPTGPAAPTGRDGAEPGRGTGPAGASPRDGARSSGASPVRPLGSTPPAASAPVGAAPPNASASDTTSGAPAAPAVAPVITRVQPVPPAYPGTTPSGAGRHARPHSSTSSSSSFKAAVTVRSGGPSPVPAALPDAGPASDRPVDRPSDRPATPDFGRIAGAGVGAVAVPVAAVVRVARRRNVIGAETTGSIPVHLLFRDQPGNAVPFAAGEDDGGPDTVAMAAPTLPRTGAGAAIPGPSKVQAQDPEQLQADAAGAGAAGRAPSKRKSKSPSKAELNGRLDGRLDERLDGRLARRLDAPLKARSASHPGAQAAKASAPATASTSTSRSSASRPAPTADPALVERPGPVLPGWVGVVGGALALAACAAVVWWTGAVPEEASRMLRLPERPYNGIHLGQWALLALGVVLTLFALGGLGRGRVGYAWVLTLFGDYRGTVRRTGLVWVSPLLLRRRVDVRLRHWRSEPLSAVDAKGTALDVTVLVVWRVRDTVRAALGVDGHEDYLREQVEAAMARVLSQLPADAFHEDAPTLRDAEAVGEALTRMLSAECAPVGVDVFSAQPTRIEYAPDVAAAMRRRRIAAIDAKHRDSVLTSVVDAVDDVVHRLTSRGLVELDDYERKALVKDLTVAFYTGRTGPVEGA